MRLLLAVSLLWLGGCASYNQKLIVAQVAATNASIPDIGGQLNGTLWVGYYSCLGFTCSKPDDGTVLVKAVTNAINKTDNTIITAGPVKITATPLK